MISDGLVFIDGYPRTHAGIKVNEGQVITLPSANLAFICMLKKDVAPEISNTKLNVDLLSETVETDDENTIEVDQLIDDFLAVRLQLSRISDLKKKEEKNTFCHLLSLVEDMTFGTIKQSSYSYEITDYLKDIYTLSPLGKELDFPKTVTNFTSRLLESLISAKQEKISQLTIIVSELTAGLYDKSLYKFLQDYSRVAGSAAFQYLVEPLLDNLNISRLAIENLIKPIQDVKSYTEIDRKFLHFEENKNVYDRFSGGLNGTNKLQQLLFAPIVAYLNALFSSACEVTEVKLAELEIQPAARKYNFNTPDRTQYDLLLVIKNTGEGLARETTISSDDTSFRFADYSLGLLKPGENRDIILQADFVANSDSVPQLRLICTWQDTSSEQRTIRTLY